MPTDEQEVKLSVGGREIIDTDEMLEELAGRGVLVRRSLGFRTLLFGTSKTEEHFYFESEIKKKRTDDADR